MNHVECPLCRMPMTLIDKGEEAALYKCTKCAETFVYERRWLAKGIKHSA